jgi:predicted dehydrogenase
MTFAVIGLGRMGLRHLQAVRALGGQVVGVCDSREQALRNAADTFGIASGLLYREAESLLTDRQPDCAIIATTAPSHCTYTCLAAESGVSYVLCEKPMAVSLEQCDRMIAVCAAYGTSLAVNHQMRFMVQYQAPKRLASSDDLGGLRSITIVSGNGGLGMNGTHFMEMFRYVTGEHPVELTAWFSAERVPNPRGALFEDRAGSIRAVTSSGHRFFLDASADQGHGRRVTYACSLGQVVVDEHAGSMTISHRAAEDRALPTTRYLTESVQRTVQIGAIDLTGPTTRVLQALAAAQGYPSGEDGRLAVACLVAAHLSDEQGHRPVIIGAELPRERTFPWA